MGKVHLKTFCGYRLETVAWIKACEETVVAIITIVISCITANYLEYSSGFAGLGAFEKNQLYALSIMMAGYGYIQLVASLLLLIAITDRKPSMMRPWFWSCVAYIFMGVVTIVTNLVVFLSSGLIGLFVSAVVLTLIGCAMKMYCVYIIYSYYKELGCEYIELQI